jgi:hypothetical protein
MGGTSVRLMYQFASCRVAPLHLTTGQIRRTRTEHGLIAIGKLLEAVERGRRKVRN